MKDKFNGQYITCFFLFFAWSTLIGSVFIASIPYNPLQFSIKVKKNINFIFPEGWAFFTLSPRTERTHVYSVNSDKFVLMNFKNTSAQSFFGLSRYNRIRNIELAFLLSKIDSAGWGSCKSNIEQCIDFSSSVPITISNQTNIKCLIGKFVIVKNLPVPWAWSKSKEKLKMPVKYAYINVVRK